MNEKIIEHYLSFSSYTYPGLYLDKLKKLPDNIEELGFLLRKNIIHRTTLALGNTGTNEDLRFGDMKKVPWYRQAEDDIFPTASSMISELYRRDERGFVMDRSEENKLVVTCRFVSILMVSILKSKGIPSRVRSGHANYFTNDSFSRDHWICEYYDLEKEKWITIDVDGSLSIENKNVNPYNLSKDDFDFPAKNWLDIRSGKENPFRFKNAKPEIGLLVVLWALFYDFHSLMNNEIIYLHQPVYGTYNGFSNITEKKLNEIDKLAENMLKPDENFEKLKEFYDRKDFRLLYGGLL